MEPVRKSCLRGRFFLHRYDSARAKGIGVLLADHAVQNTGDVVDEHLVVQHHFILEHVAAAEHGEAVAAVFEHVVVRSQGTRK